MNSSLYAVLVPALLPVLLIIIYIYKKDKKEKEPLGLVLKTLIWGAILSLPCAGVEMLMELILGAFFEQGTVSYAAAENIIGVALIEELAKYIVIMRFIWKNDNFDYRYDGIVYAASASLGFAALENVLYLLNFGTDISLGRALFSIPGHTTFGVFMGLYISRAKEAMCSGKTFRMKRLKIKALLVPTIIHGIYDFLLDDSLQENYFYLFIVFVIIIDIIALSIIRREHKHDKPLGVIRKSDGLNAENIDYEEGN